MRGVQRRHSEQGIYLIYRSLSLQDHVEVFTSSCPSQGQYVLPERMSHVMSIFFRNLRPCSDQLANQTSFRTRPTPAELAALNTRPCSCAIGTQQCPPGAEGTAPPIIQVHMIVCETCSCFVRRGKNRKEYGCFKLNFISRYHLCIKCSWS
jgi:hypothetical protein